MSARHDPDRRETLARFEYGTDETPVETIVTAVADVTGNSLLEMKPLGEVVDPDALSTVVNRHDGRSSPATVTFEYCDQCVTVTPDSVEIAHSNASE